MTKDNGYFPVAQVSDARTHARRSATKTMMTMTRGRRATSALTLLLAVLAGFGGSTQAAPGDSFCDYFAASLTCAVIMDATTCNANSLCGVNGSECELTNSLNYMLGVYAATDTISKDYVAQVNSCDSISSQGSCTGDCAWDANASAGEQCGVSATFTTTTYARCGSTSDAARVGAGTATIVAAAVSTAGILLA